MGLALPGNELLDALRESGFTAEEVSASGICDAPVDSGRNAIYAPVPDPMGRIMAIAGQRTDNDLAALCATFPDSGTREVRTGGKVRRREPPVFGLAAARDTIRSSGEALVTLGPLEAVLLHERGVTNAISTMGRGLGQRGATELLASGAERIRLLYPADGTGDTATAESVAAAFGIPSEVEWAQTPGRRSHHSLRAVADAAVRASHLPAENVASTVVSRIVGRFDLGDPQQVVDCTRHTCDALSRVCDGDVTKAGILADLVADAIGVRGPYGCQSAPRCTLQAASHARPPPPRGSGSRKG